MKNEMKLTKVRHQLIRLQTPTKARTDTKIRQNPIPMTIAVILTR